MTLGLSRLSLSGHSDEEPWIPQPSQPRPQTHRQTRADTLGASPEHTYGKALLSSLSSGDPDSGALPEDTERAARKEGQAGSMQMPSGSLHVPGGQEVTGCGEG